MSRHCLYSLFSSAALALALVGQSGATTVTIGGTNVAGQGEMSSVMGATTITFNGVIKLPTNFKASGKVPPQPLVFGSVWNHSLTKDKSTYVQTGEGTIADTLMANTNYFGFYWGSAESDNLFQLTDTNGHTFSIRGHELDCDFGFDRDKNSSYFINFFAGRGNFFTTASFSSNDDSFKFDNVATATATPEPAGVAMLAGGLLIVAGTVRRRKA